MDEERKTEMTWTVRQSEIHPDKFAKLKIVYAAAVLFAIILGFVTKGLVFPVLFVIVVAGSTYEYFGGRKFSLNEQIARSGPNEMTWTTVKSVHVRQNEVYLSPFTGESKLDAFRGVKLNTQNVSKESVLEFIREHVEKDVQFLGE